MEVLASTTGVQLTLQAGVNASMLPKQAITRNGGNLRPSQVACFRAHANTWQAILRSGHETALVIEADVDWDVNIRQITGLLAQAMRSRTWAVTKAAWPFSASTPPSKATTESATHQPTALYGVDWDVTYVGTCWDIRNDTDLRHTPYFDPHGPTADKISAAYADELKSYGHPPSNEVHQIKRILTPSYYPVCTNGYAVTRSGAQKLLWRGAYEGVDGKPIDLAMIG